jgi:L-type amino acid transporter 5
MEVTSRTDQISITKTTEEEDDSGLSNKKDPDDQLKLKRKITLLNGIALVIGTIIGSGIFVSPKGVFKDAGESIYWALGIWAFCGIFSMMGSLCFCELGTTITRSGGEYAYVLEAFGPLVGFLNLWIQLLVIRPTTQAISSITFAHYVMSPFYDGCPPSPLILRLTAASCLCE